MTIEFQKIPKITLHGGQMLFWYGKKPFHHTCFITLCSPELLSPCRIYAGQCFEKYQAQKLTMYFCSLLKCVLKILNHSKLIRTPQHVHIYISIWIFLQCYWHHLWNQLSHCRLLIPYSCDWGSQLDCTVFDFPSNVHFLAYLN